MEHTAPTGITVTSVQTEWAILRAASAATSPWRFLPRLQRPAAVRAREEEAFLGAVVAVGAAVAGKPCRSKGLLFSCK